MSTPILTDTETAYLDLLQAVLTDYDRVAEGQPEPERLAAQHLRLNGLDWPTHALTMVGVKRLSQFRNAVETVILQGVRGDIIETGVWRGGACIMARAVLKAFGITDRTVWVADSFQGLPPPEPEQYPADAGDQHYLQTFLKVDRAAVEQGFVRFGLMDSQVQFLEGWFKDSLRAAPIDTLSVLRLDGDMYQSTMEALEALYHKVSPGGFVIVDDYGAVEGCRRAVDDFRTRAGIEAPLIPIDWTGCFWRVPLTTASALPPMNARDHGPNLDLWSGYAVEDSRTRVEAAQTLMAEDQSPAALERVRSLAHEALRLDPNAMPAHVILARLALPGPDYLHHLAAYHAQFSPRTYLEIGVFKGESLKLAQTSTRCVAIDPAPQPEAVTNQKASHVLCLGTSDAFFRSGYDALYLGAPGFDFAFIDGAHGFEHVLRDFIHAEACAAPGAVIALHDCLPLDEATASETRKTTFYSGDGWKLLRVLTDLRPDLKVRVIETFPTGLTLVSQVSPLSRYLRDHYAEIVSQYSDLTWSDYQRFYNREMIRIPNQDDVWSRAVRSNLRTHQRAFVDHASWVSWSMAVPEIFDQTSIHQSAVACQSQGIVDHTNRLKAVAVKGLNYREDLLVDGLSARDRAVRHLAAQDCKAIETATDLAVVDGFSEIGADGALYLSDVLQTVVDIRRALYRVRRKMAAGAIVYATVPFAYNEEATLLIGGDLSAMYPPDWQCLPGWSLTTDALAAGFERAEIVFLSRPDLAILGAEIAGVFVLRAVA